MRKENTKIKDQKVKKKKITVPKEFELTCDVSVILINIDTFQTAHSTNVVTFKPIS